MRFDRLKPGMTVYDVRRTRMGNTNQSSIGVWAVKILEVDHEALTVRASWNSTAARIFTKRIVSAWREVKPVLIQTPMGAHRLATREEQKAMQASFVPVWQKESSHEDQMHHLPNGI